MAESKRKTTEPPTTPTPAEQPAVEALRHRRDEAAATGDAALTAHLGNLVREAEQAEAAQRDDGTANAELGKRAQGVFS